MINYFSRLYQENPCRRTGQNHQRKAAFCLVKIIFSCTIGPTRPRLTGRYRHLPEPENMPQRLWSLYVLLAACRGLAIDHEILAVTVSGLYSLPVLHHPHGIRHPTAVPHHLPAMHLSPAALHSPHVVQPPSTASVSLVNSDAHTGPIPLLHSTTHAASDPLVAPPQSVAVHDLVTLLL